MTTLSTAKRIQFNRADMDYSAYYDGELIGIFATYHQAEIELDAHALDLLEHGLIDTTEGITTMQWQGEPAPVLNDIPAGHRRAGDDEAGWWYRLGMGLQVWITDAPEPSIVYARPAEVAELVYADPARALVAQKRDEAGAYDDMLHSAEPDPNDEPPPDGPGAPPNIPSDGNALPAATPATAIEAHTPCTTNGPEVSTGAGREEAAPMSGFFLACTICGGPHVPTQCPQVAAEKARQIEQTKWGETIWYLYRHQRDVLRHTLGLAPQIMGQRAEALALYLTHTTGVALDVAMVERDLTKLMGHENAAPAQG